MVEREKRNKNSTLFELKIRTETQEFEITRKQKPAYLITLYFSLSFNDDIKKL